MTDDTPVTRTTRRRGGGPRRADAVAHAAACDACRALVDDLREALALAQSDRAAEPSPLFWDHLSARVGTAVRAEAERRARRVPWLWRWGPVSALAAAVLMAALVVMPRAVPA